MYKDLDLCLKKLCFKNCFNCDNFIGQQLAFDIDPENIKCSCKSKFPHFCDKCLSAAIRQGASLADELKKKFTNVKLAYSGRGCHVHVFDEKVFYLSVKEREILNNDYKKYGIDSWVSKGFIRLIRLPYSLNGLVSRIVTPLSYKECLVFNPLNNKETIPNFLKKLK